MQVFTSLDQAQAWAEVYADTLRAVYYVYRNARGWRVTGKKPETGLYYVFRPEPRVLDSEVVSTELAALPTGVWG